MTALYDIARENFAAGNISWVRDGFEARLMYRPFAPLPGVNYNTVSNLVDDFIVGVTPVTNRTVTNGYVASDPFQFLNVIIPANELLRGVAISHRRTGWLVAWISTDAADRGLGFDTPVPPGGLDVWVLPDQTFNGAWFRL